MQVEYDGKNATAVFEFVRRAQEAGVALGVMTLFEMGRVDVTLMVGDQQDSYFSMELVAGDVLELGSNGQFSFHRKI
jgi:hypothetical protein